MDAIFGNGRGEGKGGIARAEDWRDAISVLARQETAEDALWLPANEIGPFRELASQFGDSGIGLVRNHHVIAKALDPAFCAGGEAMSRSALLLKGIAQGRINPLSGGRGEMSWGERSHSAQCDAGTGLRQTRKQVATRKQRAAAGRSVVLWLNRPANLIKKREK